MAIKLVLGCTQELGKEGISASGGVAFNFMRSRVGHREGTDGDPIARHRGARKGFLEAAGPRRVCLGAPDR